MAGGWSTYCVRNGWVRWACSAWRRQGFRETKSSLRGGYKQSRARLYQGLYGGSWEKNERLWTYMKTGEASTSYNEKKLTMSMFRHCMRMAREVMKSLSLEVFKFWLDEALSNLTWIQFWLCFELKLGQNDLPRFSLLSHFIIWLIPSGEGLGNCVR